MRILIVGGGIGGLATALTLHARGIDCTVYEQSGAIRELGVGVNILPHAIKVLVELGLLEELDAVAIRTRELIMTDRRGNEIWREARGLHAGYDVPQFSVHRGRLQGVLYRAVRERLGETAVVVGRRLFGLEVRRLNDGSRTGRSARRLPNRARRRRGAKIGRVPRAATSYCRTWNVSPSSTSICARSWPRRRRSTSIRCATATRCRAGAADA